MEEEKTAAAEKRRPFFKTVAEAPARFLRWLSKTWLGRLFSGYDVLCDAQKESRLYAVAHSPAVKGRWDRFRLRTSSFFSNRHLHKLYTDMAEGLQYIEVGCYGILSLTFGIYTAVFALIQHYLLGGEWNKESLIVGSLLFLFGFFLSFSRRPFWLAAQTNPIVDFLVYRTLGFSKRSFKRGKTLHVNAIFPVILGSVLGLLTLLVTPLRLLLTMFAALVLILLYFSPELYLYGSLCVLPLFLPFQNTAEFLVFTSLVSTLGYLIKVILGQRPFTLRPLDFSVLGIGAILALSSLFSAGGTASGGAAWLLVAFLLFYFLAVNLLNTQPFINRAVNSLLSGGLIAGIAALLDLFFGAQIAARLQNPVAYALHERIFAFCAGGGLGLYLLLLLPFAIVKLLQKTSPGRFTGFALTFLILAACGVFFFTGEYWISFAVAIFFFSLALRPSSVYVTGPLTAIFGVLLALSPQLASFDCFTEERAAVYRGTLSMIWAHFWQGVGVGEEAFASSFSYYASAEAEGAQDAANLYLQTAASCGVFGLLALLLFCFLFFQAAITQLSREKNPILRKTGIGAAASILAFLVCGAFVFPFTNGRIFFLFFAVAAIGVAVFRVGKREEGERTAQKDKIDEAVSLDIVFK